jgi:hypothetical protein
MLQVYGEFFTYPNFSRIKMKYVQKFSDIFCKHLINKHIYFLRI